ncbi:MAG: SMP-30/gluconolactonase/LRE family protein [Proteobacteria bacterium]|nr:SMP-30/gluconolactonase/LRE family protein [Pseudomonadota bacterium]
MKHRCRYVAALALAPVLYLAFWPVPIEPVPWAAPRFEGYAGAHARNERLAGAQVASIAPEIGPEHIAVGPDGYIYTGTLSGAVLRLNPRGQDPEVYARTGGRPLGMAFGADGRLVVADAFRGLLRVAADRSVQVIADQVNGAAIGYADAVAIAPDGRIFFTDATQRFSARRYGTFDAALLDVLEHSCTGRVLVYEPGSGTTSVMLTGLCFANGVALSADAGRLYVSETGAYRIWSVDAAVRGLDVRRLSPGERRASVFADNLPGFPDNLTRSASGRLWTGLTKPRSRAIDALAAFPRLRSLMLRLPRALWPVPKAYGHVIAFDASGRVVADLQDPSGRIPETSGATEQDGRLYVQSLSGSVLGVLPIAALDHR